MSNDTDGRDDSGTETRTTATAAADAFERFPLDEWAALRERVREVDATATDSADEVVVDDGTARLVVTREGTVSGSMPRHEFARDGVDAVEVAEDGSALRVSGVDPATEYVFRL